MAVRKMTDLFSHMQGIVVLIEDRQRDAEVVKIGYMREWVEHPRYVATNRWVPYLMNFLPSLQIGFYRNPEDVIPLLAQLAHEQPSWAGSHILPGPNADVINRLIRRAETGTDWHYRILMLEDERKAYFENKARE